ncbi:MAG: phosphoribosylamine--glycine ligase [Proteobacteria bacterium]|nr:phosphoribosylamine--glycine ligase [Pseudomonadota bacterium]
MKVLVIGSGGREHALAWKLAAAARVSRVYVAPGNGGTALDERFESVAITEVGLLCAWAQQNKIALTVVGPEAPLAAGVVDAFRAHGLRIFGPTRAAAQLESSKAFAKDFMQRHGIPTAEYQVFTDAPAAHGYVDAKGAPIVVKADGLAAGKGVVVAMTAAEAHAAIDAMLPAEASPATGDAAPRVVIEEHLHGEEASFIVLCDGKNVVALATSQDHKRLLDGDRGPNTGGMGAYSPAPVVTAEIHARVMREVILPTLRGMEQDGIRYTGFLYAGLMIAPDGRPRTLEFNCRLGDPEAQPILMRLKSDLFEVLWAATEPGLHGQLDRVDLQWDRRTALGVVLAAHGYPANPRRGDAITGLPAEADDAVVFHAGTALDGGVLRTAGGRVLCVTVLADKIRLAQERAYELVRAISFDGMQYRRDIGHRASV